MGDLDTERWGEGGIPYLVSQCTVQYTYTIDHCVKFDIGHLSYDNIILKKFFFSFNILSF